MLNTLLGIRFFCLKNIVGGNSYAVLTVMADFRDRYASARKKKVRSVFKD